MAYKDNKSNSKERNRMDLANQLHKVHQKLYQARSITASHKRENIKNVYKKSLSS